MKVLDYNNPFIRINNWLWLLLGFCAYIYLLYSENSPLLQVPQEQAFGLLITYMLFGSYRFMLGWMICHAIINLIYVFSTADAYDKTLYGTFKRWAASNQTSDISEWLNKK